MLSVNSVSLDWGMTFLFFVFKRLKVLFEEKYEHEFFLFLKVKLVFSFLLSRYGEIRKHR